MPIWTVPVEGASHTVELKEGKVFRHLFIDNIEEPIRSRLPLMTVVDRTIWLGTKPVQLVIVGKKADLAVDGVFLTSGEPYRAVNRIPWFVWLFFILSPILGLLLADLAGFLLGFVAGYFYLRVAVAPDMPVKKQVLICLGIFALCMAVDAGLHVLIRQWMGEDGYLMEQQMLENLSQYTGDQMLPGQ